MMPSEKTVQALIDSMKVVIELVRFFKDKKIDPTVALIAMGKFIAIHHSMHSKPVGDELQEAFIEALRKEYTEIRQLKESILADTKQS